MNELSCPIFPEMPLDGAELVSLVAVVSLVVECRDRDDLILLTYLTPSQKRQVWAAISESDRRALQEIGREAIA